MDSTHIPLTELADERGLTVAQLRQICTLARVPIPRSECLSPSAWRKLDAYIFRTTGKGAGEALRQRP